MENSLLFDATGRRQDRKADLLDGAAQAREIRQEERAAQRGAEGARRVSTSFRYAQGTWPWSETSGRGKLHAFLQGQRGR